MTDDDTTDIPPALTAEQWAKREWRKGKSNVYVIRQMLGDPPNLWVAGSGGPPVEVKTGEEFAVLIALANAAMHDEDPRKIRREHVELLRAVAKDVEGDYTADGNEQLWDQASELYELADALESYLPSNRR